MQRGARKWRGNQTRKSVSFVRDEQTRRFLFNAKALQALGIKTATLHVRRAKQGTPSTHPIVGDELRALRRLQRDQEPLPELPIALNCRLCSSLGES